MPKERIDIEVKWPENWIEAFRERWFPAWLLRRKPIRYKSVSVHRTLFEKVCPHIRVPGHGQHVQWMVGDE
jgi:hypothetical protein